MRAFDLLVQLGIKVFEVPDLDYDVIFEHGSGGGPARGFIRADLSPEARVEAASWLLDVALDDLLRLQQP